jgi:hypothetical protein
MHASFTSTASQTNTFTDSRLRAIMPEVGADFFNMAGAGLITFEKADSWTDDLTVILQNQAAYGFQVQLTYPNGQQVALDYRVSSDGSIRESGAAGGIDYYALPTGTRAVLFLDLNFSAKAIDVVQAYGDRRGWGRNGHRVQGDPVRDRAYSKDGYGVIRGKIGDWP